jgi:tetratricopeptide (TPR) repeat protein/O-antigen ligase
MTPQKIIRPIVFVALFLIPFFPLIVANPFFFPFITGKAFYFRILVEIAFAGWVILAFWDARYRPRLTPLTIGVTLFMVIALIADLLGVNPLRSIWSNFERMEGWLVIVHLWAFFMSAKYMFGSGEEGKRMWHRWFNVSIGVAVITAIYGISQLMGWADIHQGSIRVDASLGNAAYFAVYMLMHTGIAAYMYFVARAKKIANAGFLTWMYPILAVVFGFLVFESQTRGTILGLIGATMLALALYALFARGAEAKKSRMISTGIIVLIIIVGAVFWMNRASSFVQKSPVLNRIASISWKETQTQARAYIWPMAIRGTLERPLLGWGQENFNYIFNANYNPKMYSQEQWFDRAHSVFLDWFVASGFVGLISYLALYVLFIIAIWKRAPLTVAEKSVLTGLIAGYAVHNIFVFDNLASYVSFFALLGFAGSIAHKEHGKAKSNIAKTNHWLDKKEFSADAVEYIVMPIVLVGLVASIYFLNVRPIQANTRLITALQSCSGRMGTPDTAYFGKALAVGSYLANQEIREQVISCTGSVISNGSYPGPTKQAFFDLATKVINDQVATTPGDARMYVIGGAFMNALGQIDQALPLLEKANELTPNKQSNIFQLANAYINAQKNDEALALLKAAYESETSYEDAKSAYATGLILAGKEAEAKTIFKDSPDLFETGRVAQAYVSLKQYQKAISIYEKLIKADPKNVQLKAQLAQTQYVAGMIGAATETLRGIAKDHPEFKDQAETAIKQMNAGK